MPEWQAGPAAAEARKVVRVLTKSRGGGNFVRVLTIGSKTATRLRQGYGGHAAMALNAEYAENAENGLNPGNGGRHGQPAG